MPSHVDVLTPAIERAREAPSRQTVSPSAKNRCDVAQFDVIGREAYPLHDYAGGGINVVVVATAWLAFYVIAIIQAFASGY